MNKVKKISLMLAIMLVILVGVAGQSFAALKVDPNLGASKSEVQPGEQFTVTYNISNVQGDKGIIALSGTIKYDKNVLELVNKSGSNSWSNPSLNGDMFVTDREDLGKVNETVFTLTFKVKDGATGNTNITVENVMASDGDGDVNVSNASKTITIKKSENKDDDITNIPTSTTNKDKDKNQTATLPKTGEGHFGIIAGGVALMSTVFAVVFYRKLNK